MGQQKSCYLPNKRNCKTYTNLTVDKKTTWKCYCMWSNTMTTLMAYFVSKKRIKVNKSPLLFNNNKKHLET
ncbi:hypothetical protein Hanom_Chr13g01185301 [Helianthus anomalus]